MVVAVLAQPPQVPRSNETAPPLDYQGSKATRQIKPVSQRAAKRHAGNVEVIMNYRIVTPSTAFEATIGKNTKPVKAPNYLAFIRGLPCLISHAYGVEAAHLSAANERYGHTGRGKSQKASDRHALPLCSQMHREQHDYKFGEVLFWDAHSINPYEVANALWGAYQERGEDCQDWAVRMILSGKWSGK